MAQLTKIEGELGVEVECVFKRSKSQVIKNLAAKKKWRNENDGSIREYDYSTHTSAELKLRYNLKDLDKLFKDYKVLTNHIQVNKSCGLHLHVSFEQPAVYFKLASFDFPLYISIDGVLYKKKDDFNRSKQ